MDKSSIDHEKRYMDLVEKIYMDMVDDLSDHFNSNLVNESGLLTINNFERLNIKNPTLEIIKNLSRYDEYYIIYGGNWVMDMNEVKRQNSVKFILKRISDKGRYKLMGETQNGEYAEVMLYIETIRNINKFNDIIMEMVSTIINSRTQYNTYNGNFL